MKPKHAGLTRRARTPRLALLLLALGLVLWPAALPVDAALPLQQGDQPHVENEYIQVQAGGRGQFTIGTLQGDPATAGDDQRRLMYGHFRRVYTSFTSLRIVEGQAVRDEVLSLARGEPPRVDGDAIVLRTQHGDVRVEQRLAPAHNPYTDRPDTVRIATTATNGGSRPLRVGVRLMLDTMIGANDYAPFFIPGTGNTNVEQEYRGSEVPIYWKAFEALDYHPASLKGQGILNGFGATPPDRFVVARWPSIKGSTWDYDIIPNMAVGDSAVAIYWDPRELAPGTSATWVTYYGLAGIGGGNAWIDAPLNATSLEPEFPATLWVSNLSEADFVGGEAVLSLPPGLGLAPGESLAKPMPRVPMNGGAQSVTWRLVAGGTADTTYAYSGTVSFESGSRPMSADAELQYRFIAPPVAQPAATATAQPTATPRPTASPGARVPRLPPAAPPGGLPWWPLLLLPLLGLPLLWLLFRRRPAPVPPAPPPSHPRPAARINMDTPTRPARPPGADITHGRTKKPPSKRDSWP